MKYGRPIRLPPLRSIEAFIWACRLGSLKAASEKLNVTVSAISRRIQTLEQELGVSLFDRQARGMELTPMGTRYLDLCMPPMDELLAATSNFHAEQEQTPVRISVGSAFENHWLTPRLSRLFERYPNFQLELVTANDPRVQVLNVDASIWFAPPGSNQPGAERITDIAMYPVCHPRLVETGNLTKPEELQNHVIIDLVTTPYAWQNWLKSAGVPNLQPRATLSVDNLDSAFHAASKGLGVALGIDHLVDSYCDRRELVRPFNPDLNDKSTIYLVLNPASASRPAVQAFRAWLRREIISALQPPEPLLVSS